MIRTAFVSLGLAAAACAAPRPVLGTVSLRPEAVLEQPVDLTVEPGRIFGAELDVALGPDGCVRADNRLDTLVLCELPRTEGEARRSFAGSGGELVCELSEGGDELAVDGQLILTGRRRAIHSRIALAGGRQWDELRRNPVLLAVAAGLAAQGRALSSTRVLLPGRDPRPRPVPPASQAANAPASGR